MSTNNFQIPEITSDSQ